MEFVHEGDDLIHLDYFSRDFCATAFFIDVFELLFVIHEEVISPFSRSNSFKFVFKRN